MFYCHHVRPLFHYLCIVCTIKAFSKNSKVWFVTFVVWKSHAAWNRKLGVSNILFRVNICMAYRKTKSSHFEYSIILLFKSFLMQGLVQYNRTALQFTMSFFLYIFVIRCICQRHIFLFKTYLWRNLLCPQSWLCVNEYMSGSFCK